MARMRNVLNVTTGKAKTVPYTRAENDAADIAAAEELKSNEARTLSDLKLRAENAEMRQLIDIDAGTTTEAAAYQAEKERQNK